ncbi:MAG: hypothetical protein NZ805_12340 [Armatimonadetes bacterium]|nr:hypothetical protein [Armatimonadota bacterium]
MTVLLLVIFIVINALWDAYGLITGQMRPSTVSLFVNVVATIFVVTITSELARTLFSRSISPSKLLWLYVSLSVASAFCTFSPIKFQISPLIGMNISKSQRKAVSWKFGR